MEYKVIITKNNDLLIDSIKTFVNCLLVTVALFYLMNLLYPKKFEVEFFYSRGILMYLVLFWLNFRKIVYKEKLTINNEFIDSELFGRIFLNEIQHYKIKNIKGQGNLILKTQDGRKLSIWPRYSTNKTDRTEFPVFLEHFENKINGINKSI